LLAPLLLKTTPFLLRQLDQMTWLTRFLPMGPEPQLVGIESEKLQHHVVVAGYGRVGRTLVRMLYFQGYSLLVIDNNEAAFASLREQGIPYLFGDAASEAVLERANLPQAKSMAITLPDPMATRLTVNRALSLVPDLDITVRAHVNEEIESLYQLGANEVVQPEFEAALEMGAHMLIKLGDKPQEVQQVVQRYRNGHYRDILPARSDYWGVADLDTVISGLGNKWYPLSDRCPIVGHTLAESNIRRNTGATVMAVERDRKIHRYPTGDMCLMASDRLLVVGSQEELIRFEQLVAVPSESV
jgi:monovalent cation:H+ antiporter-2, CPA2 family